MRPAILLLATLLLGAQHGRAQTWNGFRGPNGDGSIETSEATAPSDLRVRWKIPLGSGYSGVSVAEGLAVTMDTDGESDRLIAFHTSTGTEAWKIVVAPNYQGHDGSVDGPVSTPAISEGRVFALDPGGRFLAVDLETGDILWERDLSADRNADDPYYGFGSSPLVFGDTVLVQVGGSHGALMAMRAVDGRVLWSDGEGVIDEQSPKRLSVDGFEQIVYATNESLRGVDPGSGRLLWEWEHDGGNAAFGSNTTSPLPLPDGRIHFTATNDEGVLLRVPRDSSEVAAPVPAPEELWRSKAMSRTYSPPTHWRGDLYGFTARLMTSWDLETGQMNWRSRDPGDGFATLVDGHLIVATKSGSLHLAPASEQGWQEIAAVELFDELVWTPPTYADGAIWARSIGAMARVDLIRGPSDPTLTSTDRGDSESPVLAKELVALRASVDAAADIVATVDEWIAEHDWPVVDGDRVLFVWRGEADDVGITGDFLGVRVEQPLTRLEGTDLWWYETRIDPRVQVAYVFHVDYVPRLDPLNADSDFDTIIGYDANWLQADVEPVAVSVLRMPGRPRDPGYLEQPPGGTIDRFEVTIPAGDEGESWTLPVVVWRPDAIASEAELRSVYVLSEGNRAIEDRFGAWSRALTAGGDSAPTIAVFVGADEPFPSNPFPTLVEIIDERHSTSPNRRDRGIVGIGFPAIEALMSAFDSPELFGSVATQSFLGFHDEIAAALSAATAESAALHPMRVHIEWGELDIRSPSEGWDTREFNRMLVDRLRALGYRPTGGPIADSTDWRSWRTRTHEILQALLSTSP